MPMVDQLRNKILTETRNSPFIMHQVVQDVLELETTFL